MARSRPISRRTALKLGAGAAALPLATVNTTAAAENRVLRFVPISDLTSLDTLVTQTVANNEASFMVFDTLYGLDASLTPRPQMVEGHELSDDRLTWRFTLREGLLFHDREKVRAKDAVASIGRWAQRAPLGVHLTAVLNEIRPIDDRRFEIRLKKPYPHLLLGLGDGYCAIRPERVAAKVDAFTDAKDYTGSGPYVFLADEWNSGARAAFRRNGHYLPRQEAPSFLSGGKVVNFDRVEWTIIPDASTAAGALEKGEVDWLDAPLIDLVPQLRKTATVTVEQLKPFGLWFELVLNTRLPPFDNPALRRALFPAVDQSDFMQAVVGEQAELMRTGVGLFAVESPLRTDVGMQALTGPRDLDLARRLVRESGYAGAPIVQMAVSDVGMRSAVSQVAQDMMTRIGLNVVYQSIDIGTWALRIVSGARGGPGVWNCFTTFWTGMRVLYPGSHSPLFGPVPDPDPKMLELRDAWFDAPDLAAEKTIAEQMQLRMFEDAPFVPLGEIMTPSAYRTGLTGFVPSSYALFWNVRRA